MTATNGARPHLGHGDVQDLVHLLLRYKWRWIIPALFIAGGVTVFALFSDDTWEVSQAILIRNHAVSEGGEPGEFRGLDPMRRAEDTIVEVCLSRHVLTNALEEVGPADEDTGTEVSSWPSEETIQELREALSIEAPNGAEFGTTEVLHIRLRDKQRKRALALIEAIYAELQERTGELRDRRAGEMLAEVEQMVELARTDLDQTTRQIQQIEQEVGGDVVGLRMLHASPGGNGEREESLVAVDQELMQLEAAEAVSRQLLALLNSAQDNAKLLLSAPPDLLATQPVLEQLVAGLVGAKLRTEALRKNLEDTYPTVRAAMREEAAIEERVVSELSNTIQLIQADMKLQSSRQQVLEKKRSEMRDRLVKLASIRAEYSNLLDLASHRQEGVKIAEQRLGEVRARQAVARSSQMISRLDTPELGHQPLGPSRAIMILAGLVGGLFTGFGCVALTVIGNPPAATAPVNGHRILQRQPHWSSSQLEVPHEVSSPAVNDCETVSY
jgi:uncharacterized protein involved in exopolysaccharide biosynthesis